MGRHRKNTFGTMKMLASRVEESDYFKFEERLQKEGKNLQQFMNLFIVSYISGNICLSGSTFVSGVANEQ
jgi:hypothetical protein